MTTNVPQPSISTAGLVVPAESDILAGVQADIGAAFGGSLTTSLSTPQGQLASSMAAAIGDKDDQLLALVSGIDPAYAAGRMQDAIGRIYFITRNPATPTTVQATCTGLENTLIPVGALAKDTAGNTYTCTLAGKIPASGSITLPFACTVTGPTPCPAGSLSTIAQQVGGWDSVTNLADGVLGAVVESRAAFEGRRRASVAANAQGSNAAVLGAVLEVDGVLDAYVIDNPTGAPVTNGGVTIPPWSLYVCVSGGDPEAVAQAIWSKKSPGCGFYPGNTTLTVYDTSYSAPQPAYQVSFQAAMPTAIQVAVTIANNGSVPADALTLIQAAVIAAMSGADGGSRARIGATLFASRFYAGIAALGGWAQIIDIKIGIGAATATSVTLGINQAPTTSAADITMTLL